MVKRPMTANAGGEVEKWVGLQTAAAPMEISVENPQKDKINLPYD